MRDINLINEELCVEKYGYYNENLILNKIKDSITIANNDTNNYS